MSGLKGPGSRGPATRRRDDNEDDRDPPRAGRSGAAGRAPAKAATDDKLVVILDDIDPKKGSVRFNATDKDSPVTSIYINKSGIPDRDYDRVRLTIEFLDADDDD